MDWLKEWDSEDEYHSSDDDPQHSFEQDLVSDIIKELERIYAVKARVNFDVFALKYSEGELMQPAPVEVVDQGVFVRIRAYSTKLPFKEVIILSAPREAGTVHVLNIRVPEGNAPTYERNVKRLQVLWNNRTWLNFGSYLEFSTNVKFDPNYKETDVYRKTIGGHGSAALFNWYQATRKPFRFMDLPVELLLQVYSYCIGNDVCPKVITVNEKPAVGIGRGWVPSPPMSPELDSTYDLSEVVAAPNAAILSLSKNDREEALDAVWMSTRLCFAGPRSLEKMTTAPLSLPTYALKKIGLNFLSLNYIEFFGAEITFNPFLYILTINIDRE